uniref:Uncharacterized protein n=1 Tax=Romanomermis culicivorax TaxID=13658 RepID=A0A915HQN8_ROMCU
MKRTIATLQDKGTKNKRDIFGARLTTLLIQTNTKVGDFSKYWLIIFQITLVAVVMRWLHLILVPALEYQVHCVALTPCANDGELELIIGSITVSIRTATTTRTAFMFENIVELE